jgi:hypothetical protein
MQYAVGNLESGRNFFYFSHMPIPEKYLADFEEGGLFQIYNKTNNKEVLFLNDNNKYFFLKRYREILSLF